MDINPIKNKRGYQRALMEIEGLMQAKRNTPEGDRFDVLVTLAEANADVGGIPGQMPRDQLAHIGQRA